MLKWFQVKIRYTKQSEDGTFKRVTEPYLLAAWSFTDAEARIFEELGSMIRGEFMVTDISRTEYHDIFHYEDSDTWFKAKVTYVSEADDSEKKKKHIQHFLVTASSVEEASVRIKECLNTLMVDFLIPSINVTAIVDVFPFESK